MRLIGLLLSFLFSYSANAFSNSECDAMLAKWEPEVEITWEKAKGWRQQITSIRNKRSDIRQVDLVKESYDHMILTAERVTQDFSQRRIIRTLAQEFLNRAQSIGLLEYEDYLELAHEFVFIREKSASKSFLPKKNQDVRELMRDHIVSTRVLLEQRVLKFPDVLPLPVYRDLPIREFNKLWFAGIYVLGVVDGDEKGQVNVDGTNYFAKGFYIHDIGHIYGKLERLVFSECQDLFICVTQLLIQQAWFYDRIQFFLNQEVISRRAAELVEYLMFEFDHEMFMNLTSGHQAVGKMISVYNGVDYPYLRPQEITTSQIETAAKIIVQNKSLKILERVGVKRTRRFAQSEVAESLRLILLTP